jgi:CheY-like chemotaxis protein
LLYFENSGSRIALSGIAPFRILIAEDNPAVRTALHLLLESVDSWEVVDAQNGQEAIARAQELNPNLVILDLVMPVMDGLAAARVLSKLLPDLPLLMHTMHWSPQVELEAQKVGVRKVVPKTDSRGLMAAIQQFLNAQPANPVPAGSETALATIAIPDVAAAATVIDPAQAAASDAAEAPAKTADAPADPSPN